MSIAKKIITGTLAILIATPTISAIESSQVDAANETSYHGDYTKKIAENTYNLTMRHWIKGSDLLEVDEGQDDPLHKGVLYSFKDQDDKSWTITLPNYVTFEQKKSVLEKAGNIDPNKEYLITTNLCTESLGPTDENLTFSNINDISYLGEVR